MITQPSTTRLSQQTAYINPQNIIQTMTTRKYNMIRKNTYLDGHTFTAILDYLESVVNLDTYTAKQIADMMESCYAQNEIGYDRFAHENSIY